MRDELLLRLSDAMSNDAGLNGLVAFLHDDFPYDAEHVVGLVLRRGELRPWEELMAAVESVSNPLSKAQVKPLRERAEGLIAATRR